MMNDILDKLGITKSPWRADDGSIRQDLWNHEVEKHIGYVYPNMHKNAQLIAAAPEMLEALIKILRGFERNDCLDWGEFQTIIEKATGKSWNEITELINE